jgi:hypothetical protein
MTGRKETQGALPAPIEEHPVTFLAGRRVVSALGFGLNQGLMKITLPDT